MAGYAILYKFTEKGIADIKGAPERINQAKAMAQQMGARVVGVWVTMGEYDMIAIVDAPDDQTVAVGVLNQASQGNVTTRTMRAFSEDEFRQIIGRLP